MLFSYLTHLMRRLCGASKTMDFGTSIDATELERFIDQRDSLPPDQRDGFVQSYIVSTFYFSRRDSLPKRAAREVLRTTLLSVRSPDGFLQALRDTADRYDVQWFINNGASASDKWMNQPEWWLWSWLAMSGAVKDIAPPASPNA